MFRKLLALTSLSLALASAPALADTNSERSVDNPGSEGAGAMVVICALGFVGYLFCGSGGKSAGEGTDYEYPAYEDLLDDEDEEVEEDDDIIEAEYEDSLEWEDSYGTHRPKPRREREERDYNALPAERTERRPSKPSRGRKRKEYDGTPYWEKKLFTSYNEEDESGNFTERYAAWLNHPFDLAPELDAKCFVYRGYLYGLENCGDEWLVEVPDAEGDDVSQETFEDIDDAHTWAEDCIEEIMAEYDYGEFEVWEGTVRDDSEIPF